MKKLIPISLFAIAAFCGCGDDYIVDTIYPEYKIGAYYYESSSQKKTDTLYLMYKDYDLEDSDKHYWEIIHCTYVNVSNGVKYIIGYEKTNFWLSVVFDNKQFFYEQDSTAQKMTVNEHTYKDVYRFFLNDVDTAIVAHTFYISPKNGILKYQYDDDEYILLTNK